MKDVRRKITGVSPQYGGKYQRIGQWVDFNCGHTQFECCYPWRKQRKTGVCVECTHEAREPVELITAECSACGKQFKAIVENSQMACGCGERYIRVAGRWQSLRCIAVTRS